MTEHSTDQPADQPIETRSRTAVIWAVAAAIGLVVAVASALVAGSLSSSDSADDSRAAGSVKTDDGLSIPDDPVQVVGPYDSALDAHVGAAVLGMVETEPGVEGLPDGTWITEVGALHPLEAEGAESPPAEDGDDAGTASTTSAVTAPATTLGPDGTVSVPGSDATPPQPPTALSPDEVVDLGSFARDLGALELAGTMDLSQFIDTCAEGDDPCPPGEPGTVTPFAGGVGGGDSLRIRLWPGLNGLTATNLTCNSEYATSTRLPLVVTADDPVGSISVTLSIDGVGELDKVQTDVSSPKKKTDWEARVKAGQPVGTDLSNSIHYCFSLRTEGDPANAATLAGTAIPDGASYRITVQAETMDGNEQAAATTTHPIPTTFERPATLIWPLSTHRAQVIVHQIGSDVGRVRVWAERVGGSGVDGDCSTFGSTDTSGAPGFLSSYPSAEPRKLVVPSDPYAYDRAYDHFTVWNLLLRDTSSYWVCVQWRADDGVSWGPSETWEIDTPGALHLDVWVDTFSAPGSNVTDLYSVDADIAGCNRWTLNRQPVDNSAGTGLEACRSDGWPVPISTTLTMERFNSKTGAYVQMGSSNFLTPTNCEGAVEPGGSFSYKFPCGPKTDNIKLYWATDQNTLCGGPIASCAGDAVEATMTGQLRIFQPWYTGVPTGPLNWGISRVGATYGPGLPGGGQSLP